MHRTAVIGAVVFFLSASLLLVSIVGPGLAALGAFRTLPRIGLDLPAYRAFSNGDPTVAGRLAAGYAVEELFRATTGASAVLAVVGALAWGGVILGGAAVAIRPWTARAALAAMIAVIAVAAIAQQDEPRLTEALERYRERARSDSRQTAEEARGVFDALHRRAERLRQIQAIGTLMAIALASGSLVGAAAAPRGRGAVP